MDDKKSQLNEQEAPLKNTDHAYVQVGRDGSPVIPNVDEEKKDDADEQDNSKTEHQP